MFRHRFAELRLLNFDRERNGRDISFEACTLWLFAPRQNSKGSLLVLTLITRIVSHPDSFERLVAISRHPVISQHVTHLFYQPDALDLCECREDWQVGVSKRYLPVKPPTNPDPGASEREYRAYNRACVKFAQDPGHQLQRHEMDQGYIEYQRLFAAQEQLRKQDYGAPILLDVFSRLPKLVSIFTSLGCNLIFSSPYLMANFKAGLRRPYGDIGHGQPTGVPQLRSLLLGSHHAGRQLTRLFIGDVNWQFLREGADNISMMKQSLHHLRMLELTISTGYDFDEGEPGPEIPECRQFLRNKALCNFLKAAPELEVLAIAFDCYTQDCATELKHIVHDHTWAKLKRVEFAKIDATEADFANFFSRHSSTLRHLGLRAIRLLERGKWVSTFENIQKTLSLTSAHMSDSIYCEDPPQYWRLDTAVWEHDDDENAQGNKTSAALSDYLVHGGTCPLLDHDKHPNLMDLPDI